MGLYEHVVLWFNKHWRLNKLTKMFKKLISNLPFNPSLINQVAFYAKRLHKEEKLRRLGAGMMVLALIIQMFALISPPEPTLAASDNDILRGGFTSRDQAVAKCRANEQGFATILNHYQVNCDLLATATKFTIKSTDNNKLLDSMGRIPQGPTIVRTGKPTDEYPVRIGNTTYYMRNLWAWDSGAHSTYDILAVQNPHGASIMILFNCGNIVTNGPYTPPAPPPPPSDPPPPPPPSTPPPPPVTPGNAVCTSLTANTLSERRFRFTATTSGQDYSVNNYVFNFGDGNTKTVRTSSKSTSTTHTYESTNNFNASVVVSVSVQAASGRTTQTVQCQTTLTTSSIDVCPKVPGDQATTAECDVCPDIPGEQSNPAECKPCDNSQNDQDTSACLVLTKTAKNNTQKQDNADNKTAYADDSITYSLRTKNTGKVTVKDFVVEENISDILDYAAVTNFHGGKLGDDNVVRWPATDIRGDGTLTKQLTIKVKSPIPATPSPISDRNKFDLVMTNVYGNAVNIRLPETVIKTTEVVTTQTLPKTGPAETVMMSTVMIMVISYFFARSRLLAKEMDMVQTEFVTSGAV